MAHVLEIRLPSVGVQYHFEPTYVMGAVEALALPEDGAVYIREDVYEALLKKDPVARFTVAHEIGHLWMHERPGTTSALYQVEAMRPHGPLEDAECQADSFAAEFLMPLGEMQGVHITAADVMAHYNVTFSAALRRVRELSAEGLVRR